LSSETARRIVSRIDMHRSTLRNPALAPRAALVLGVVAVGALGCGRTELFGARAHCAPTDTICQMQISGSAGTTGSPGTAGQSGTAGSVGSPGTAGNVGSPGTAGSVGAPGTAGTFGTAGATGTAGSMGIGGMGGTAVTCEQMREVCNDNRDNNCNGLADCRDPGCFGDPACVKPGQEVCNNGIDDDDDKLVDCADPDCAKSIACQPSMGREICDNGRDDNNDKLVDCSDPQCTMFPACLQVACTADVDFGTIAAHGASVGRAVDTTGSTQSFATCAAPGGTGRVARFVLTDTADVKLDFGQTGRDAHAIALFRAGANQACDRNPVTCLDARDSLMGSRTFSSLPAGTYWLIVQSYANTQGPVKITLSTGSPTTPEVCNNGIDDDGNGLIDCQDQTCVKAPSCAQVECSPDATIGALVVGDAAKNVRVDLTRAPDRYHPLCAGKTPGGDAAVAFTLAQAGGIQVAYQQTGHTVFSLYKQPATGTACDNSDNELGCSPEDDPAGAVAFSDMPAGRYLLIFKATSATSNGPPDAGVVNLRISAFQNRKVEICNNGIDDDANGLTDCADPTCFGISGCGAPACTPDADLGKISWGTMVSTTVDTSSAKDLYQTSCGKGNGKERVVRFTLTQPMALGVDCKQSGSHVLELSQNLAPLDTCDAHPLGCADPGVLPFGCGYSIPDLQPGTYDLIIEAFQAGQEGNVFLSLTGQQQLIREICDNGIDDDKDGFADCADRKCVTSPACEKFACRADKDVGLLPLDGSVRLSVIETASSGDDQMQTSCVSGPGGQDGVIDFQLPAKATVTLEWAQVGVHVFQLYSDDGQLLSCEAGTSFGCVSSNGQTTGSTAWKSLPPGSYHLVVDAAKAGSEGGIAVQLSGQPSP
jgi:hypothetical protein